MALRATVFVCCLSIFVSAGHGADPRREWEQPRPAKVAPDKIERPTTNTLKDSDIKDFRDQLKEVKEQIFKDGKVPAGSSFRMVGDDPKTSSVVRVETQWDQLTPRIQEQVKAKTAEPLQPKSWVQLDVETSQPTASVTNAVPISRPTSVKPEKVVVDSRPAALSVPRLSQSGRPVNATIPSQASVNAAPTSEERAPSSAADLATVARQAAGDTDGEVIFQQRPVTGAEAALPISVAPIPLPNRGVLSVREVPSLQAGVVRVEVRGNMAFLPKTLTAQMKQDRPSEFQNLTDRQDVIVTLAVKPDNTMAVASIQKRETSKETEAASAEPLVTPRALTKSDLVFQDAARSLAKWMGVDPNVVQIKTQSLNAATQGSPTVPVAVYVSKNTGEISVRSLPTKGAEPVYQVKAAFGDLALELKGSVLALLEPYSAQSAINDKTIVLVDIYKEGTDSFTIGRVTIESVSKKEVTEISVYEAPALVEDHPQPTAVSPTPTPNPIESIQTITKEAPRPTTAKVPRGLAPLVARTIQQTHGLAPQAYQIKEMTTPGQVRVETKSPKQEIVFQYQPSSTRMGLLTVGKPGDFSDEVRAQIEALLKEAIERGETWAQAALKDNRPIKVGFEVDEKSSAEKVKVAYVEPTPTEAALDLAHSVELNESDYVTVTLGAYTIIALNKGAAAQVRLGDKSIKIVSPDGEVKMFVKPHRAGKDKSQSLLMSKAALRANAQALGALDRNAAAFIKRVQQSGSASDQYLVRIDPNDQDPVLIRLAQPAKDGLSGIDPFTTKPINEPPKK